MNQIKTLLESNFTTVIPEPITPDNMKKVKRYIEDNNWPFDFDNNEKIKFDGTKFIVKDDNVLDDLLTVLSKIKNNYEVINNE